MYIYEFQEWPNFAWNHERLTDALIQLRHKQGCLIGGMTSIGFQVQEMAILETLTQDVVKSSEIEGEILDPSLVRSSVARRLGMDIAALEKIDRNVEGVVEMMLDATQGFQRPLTKERLFHWHEALFPDAWSGFSKIQVGSWRRGVVQVVSGRMGDEKIHFEAPPAESVDRQMEHFLNWINQETGIDLVLKASLAHLWFLAIHPFEDGNGRIGRAIADYLLARSENSSCRFYSLSAQIQKERNDYYSILENTQKGGLDVTSWIEWFFGCLGRAIDEALSKLDRILQKARVWEFLSRAHLNERQKKVINLMLDGFEGKLTSSKWAKIAKCSQDTAYRDILSLIEQGILVKDPRGGRSTNYSLAALGKNR